MITVSVHFKPFSGDLQILIDANSGNNLFNSPANAVKFFQVWQYIVILCVWFGWCSMSACSVTLCLIWMAEYAGIHDLEMTQHSGRAARTCLHRGAQTNRMRGTQLSTGYDFPIHWIELLCISPMNCVQTWLLGTSTATMVRLVPYTFMQHLSTLAPDCFKNLGIAYFLSAIKCMQLSCI